jgi:hypothetical protein
VDHTEFDASLKALPGQLRDAYPRAAHRGRIEQIEAHVTTLRSLVGGLPDEDFSEAEYESRILALHGAGLMKPSDHRSSVPMPSHAWERLDDALARQEAGTA